MKQSKPKADLILTNIGQLVTLAGHSRRPAIRPSVETIGVLKSEGEGLCVASSSGRVAFIGKRSDLNEMLEVTSESTEIECKGNLVTPGFVDSHTHAIFAGSREFELSMKLSGMSYLEILSAGGGILQTVRQTNEASDEELLKQTSRRLDRMMSYGTTTMETKTGYALTVNGEIRLLELLHRLRAEKGYDIEPTLLSAHAIPREYLAKGKSGSDTKEQILERTQNVGIQKYIDEVVIPSINISSERSLSRFCDVFLEEGVFSFRDAERILNHALRCGMRVKVHADEFSDQGGAKFASELGAVSADHLGRASLEGMRALAASRTVAVLLPGTLFSSFSGAYAKAREMVELGVPIALGTDLSPNSWIESMQFVISLACYGMRLTPEEAITAATINGAHAIGRADSVGSIELGKYFDVLVFDLKNHQEIPYRIASNNIRYVIKMGKVVSPTTDF
ncbi:MAG TPA: imidazolonepropionase [Nitrososphaerales archaeon]|nr:imidazolonepropionase [Nitrososphaerales archaeon]